MNRLFRIATCLGLVTTAAVLAAFQPATPVTPAPLVGPAITIQEVETASPEDYAKWIADSNKVIYDTFHFENYTKVFVGQAAGEDSGKVFAVQTAESFSKMTENNQAFEKDPGLLKLRAGMNQVRKLGNQTLLKAVRWDGLDSTSAVHSTHAVLSDEAAYLKALDALRALFDAHNLKDIKINCCRVVAGRTDYTHLIFLSCPTPERRAAMLDDISEPWAQDWITSAAKHRTVVSNGTFREISQAK